MKKETQYALIDIIKYKGNITPGDISDGFVKHSKHKENTVNYPTSLKRYNDMAWGKISIKNDDRLFSLYIRAKRNYTCEKCGRYFDKGHGLEASHFYGRGNRTTRFDEENVDVLCKYDHKRFGENPAEYVEWKKARMTPKAFAQLKLKAHKTLERKISVKENSKIIRALAKEWGIHIG